MDKLLDLLKRLNQDGISVPLMRDNKTKKGSITYTMLFLSFNYVLLCGMVNVATFLYCSINTCDPKYLSLVEPIGFLMSCSGLYYGRSKQPIPTEKKDE